MGKTAVFERYKLTVGAAGVVLLLASSPGRMSVAREPALFFFLMGSIAEFIFIPLPTGLRITVGFAVTLPCLLLYGPLMAAWVTVVGVSLAGIALRRPAGIVLFNAGQYALSALWAGWAFVRVTGHSGLWQAADLVTSHLGYVMVYVGAFFAMNHALVNCYISLRDGFRLSNLLENMKWDGYNYLLSVPLGLLLTLFYSTRGMPGALAIFASVLTVAYILRLQLSLAAANRELTVLHEVTRQMNSTLDLTRVFELTSASLRELVGNEIYALYLWDECGNRLTRSLVDPPAADAAMPEVVEVGVGPLGQLVQRRQPAIMPEPAHAWAPGPGGMGSLMAVPLPVEDRLVGLMLAGSPASGAFSKERLRIFSTLANQAAVAIENAVLYRQTELLAITDPLTGLYNYRYFYMKLGEEMRKTRQSGGQLALIYLDINDFGRYNNLYGHLAGDSVLRQFSDFLRKQVRESDVAARYAGDEFVIILPRAGRGDAELVASRLLAALANTEFAAGETGVFVSLGVGAGTACFPEDGDTESMLIHAADQSMYSHKTLADHKLALGGPACA
ncbi:MAG: sensor domain-containing diguanylate cyclase [Bacillota bacterium]